MPRKQALRELTAALLRKEAAHFAEIESLHAEPLLYGVTDGKAVGTYFELKFRTYLAERYLFTQGNAAKGIDFPDIGVDVKVTSIKQPQSSCPFRSARQKVFGLGYSLLIFVYEKTDDAAARTGRLDVRHVIFVEREQTADYQTTRGILEILARDGNKDDLLAFISDRNLPVDEIEAEKLAEEIIRSPPAQGYLTISNALQWRLQYGRVIQVAGQVPGIVQVQS